MAKTVVVDRFRYAGRGEAHGAVLFVSKGVASYVTRRSVGTATNNAALRGGMS
jgi:hypothetical protein